MSGGKCPRCWRPLTGQGLGEVCEECGNTPDSCMCKLAIQTGSAPTTIRALQEALDSGLIPDVYVSGGHLVAVERVSGSSAGGSGNEDSPLPITASTITPPMLAGILARDTYTFRLSGRDGSSREEVTPPNAVLAAATAKKEWARLRALHGIVGAPVLRPDGTLLQKPGYDEKTGLYLAPKVKVDPVPENPTGAQIEEARTFLIDSFLGDFPWVSGADKANYFALLATPILRSYLRTLIPFGLVTSTMPSSGKTILTCGLGMLYGQRVLTWPGRDDAELRKAITSVLADPVGTIIFDNLAEGTVIDSPVLARLITDRTWADRMLGKNVTAAFTNDRVWTATGNNLLLGGDMRTRSVLVGLDPKMPRPEERTGFKIANLDDWILSSANQAMVLRYLLILVADWTRSGAPRKAGLAMRQFTPWAEALGGFLDHHGIGGFLGNVDTVREIDEEDADWQAFYTQWRKIHGGRQVTSRQLRLSADLDHSGNDQWDGLFLADDKGFPLNPVALGKRLRGQVGRPRGIYVLRSGRDAHSKAAVWRVEELSL